MESIEGHLAKGWVRSEPLRRKGKEMVSLPRWIEKEAWDGFVAMRKAMKKPMTARAESLVLKTLYLLHERGHDANEALDRSTVNNWLDVYVPKDKEIPNMKREMTPREPERTPEQKAADTAARLKVMNAIRPAIKLVKVA